MKKILFFIFILISLYPLNSKRLKKEYGLLVFKIETNGIQLGCSFVCDDLDKFFYTNSSNKINKSKGCTAYYAIKLEANHDYYFLRIYIRGGYEWWDFQTNKTFSIKKDEITWGGIYLITLDKPFYASKIKLFYTNGTNEDFSEALNYLKENKKYKIWHKIADKILLK